MTMSMFGLSLVSNNMATANDLADGEESKYLCADDAYHSPLLGAEVSGFADDILGRTFEALD